MRELSLSIFSLLACTEHLSACTSEGAVSKCALLSSFVQLIVGQPFQLKRGFRVMTLSFVWSILDLLFYLLASANPMKR